MTKQHVCLNLDTEIRQWFKDNDVGLSEFFETAWHHYIESDMDTRARIIVSRMQVLDAEQKKLGDQLKKLTGKRLEDFMDEGSSPIALKDRETKNLERLYQAMSNDQRRVLKGEQLIGNRLTIHQVESWVDTRKADFNLILSTRAIMDRLKNNGFSEEAHA